MWRVKLAKNRSQRSRSSRTLSFSRLTLVVVALVASVAGIAWYATSTIDKVRGSASDVWFAPYVDTTLTPLLHFEDPLEQPSSSVVLGFVVADREDPCSPSWGTYYSLDAASRALDLDRRIVNLRERGGDVIVSFGGAINDELATVCTDTEKLTEAYQAVIDRYDLTVLDFDIEGPAIADKAANIRRAQAIQQLQKDNPGLEVWLTLPVDPNGLPAPEVQLVRDTLTNGADIAGVNVMTMNYGGSRPTGMSMREANELALKALWQQLSGIYVELGQPKADEDIWHLIGATPMIGQNDVREDIFTLEDARALVSFANEHNLGRLSFWSANRDTACGMQAGDGRVSNTCSGVSQEPQAFAREFRLRQDVASGQRAPSPHLTVTPGTGRAQSQSFDDPRTSPYPIWRDAKAYEAGAKVVWQDKVYEAKWYTHGDRPDAPVKNHWETPWRYLGPVLDSDRQAVRDSLKAVDGVRPKWASERVYISGDEVEHFGRAYRAKWWTQGDQPEEDPDQPYNHPWEYLGEVKTITPEADVSPTVTPTPGQ